MDTDKIKIFGARVRVDGTSKLAELERAEKASPPTFTTPCFIADYRRKR
jgi:hypothetical protein